MFLKSLEKGRGVCYNFPIKVFKGARFMRYEKFLSVIDDSKEQLWDISDYLWDHPETGYEEFLATDKLCGFLEAQGFSVTRNLKGIPTAFCASFGTGTPHLGLLAEYDGLDG